MGNENGGQSSCPSTLASANDRHGIVRWHQFASSIRQVDDWKTVLLKKHTCTFCDLTQLAIRIPLMQSSWWLPFVITSHRVLIPLMSVPWSCNAKSFPPRWAVAFRAPYSQTRTLEPKLQITSTFCEFVDLLLCCGVAVLGNFKWGNCCTISYTKKAEQ